MNLAGRRRVLWDCLAGARWVLPTVSVIGFLLAGAVLSRVEVDDGSPWSSLAFPTTAEAAAALRLLGADPSVALAERPA